MNIVDATKYAIEINGYIVKRVGTYRLLIKPTNTEDALVMRVNNINPIRGWQPQTEDLTSEDWTVVSKNFIKILPEDKIEFLNLGATIPKGYIKRGRNKKIRKRFREVVIPILVSSVASVIASLLIALSRMPR